MWLGDEMTEQDTRDKVITALTEISNIKSDITELKESNALALENQQKMIVKIDGLTKDRNLAVWVVGTVIGLIGTAVNWVVGHFTLTPSK